MRDYLPKLIARVNCHSRIRSQRVRFSRRSGNIIEISADIAYGHRLILVKSEFERIARLGRDIGDYSEFGLGDAKWVCRRINRRRCKISWSIYDTGEDIMRGGIVTEVY